MSPDAREALRSYRRRLEGPVWYRVLERFGLPTLLVLVLVGNELRRSEAERVERRELLEGIRAAVVKQTEAVARLAEIETEHAEAIRLTWPKVRVHEESLRILRKRPKEAPSP